MHNFTFILTTDKIVHLLGGKEVHNLQVRVEWTNHRMDTLFIATNSAEKTVRFTSCRIQFASHLCKLPGSNWLKVISTL